MKRYNYLIVGAGFFGATCAHLLHKAGKRSLVIDRRPHVAGNAYSEEVDGIQVHKYGAHIFHTKNIQVWDFVNQFTEFNHYRHSVMANYKGEIYNLPFNMNTFNRIWGVVTPDEAKAHIESRRFIDEPNNLEEQAIRLVGKDIYVKLIKDYTEKQWGKSCRCLPAFIIKRLPVRYTYNNDYFDDPYQGIPVGGYTKLVERMLEGVEVKLNTTFKHSMIDIAERIIYTGSIDEFYGYEYGALEYRSLRFEEETLPVSNYQGCSVMNYTDSTPYTRIIEHKHFEFGQQPKTVITREYSQDWKVGEEAYYPVNDELNNVLYKYYANIEHDNVRFCGRLGSYKYQNIDEVIRNAISLVDKQVYR
jgi:UDP-galactopyranose mutase